MVGMYNHGGVLATALVSFHASIHRLFKRVFCPFLYLRRLERKMTMIESFVFSKSFRVMTSSLRS